MTEDELPMKEYRRAGLEITRGNPDVYKSLWSRRDDVTLANPFDRPSAAGRRYRIGSTSLRATTATAGTTSSRTLLRSSRRSLRTRLRSNAFGRAWVDPTSWPNCHPDDHRVSARGRQLEGERTATRGPDHVDATGGIGAAELGAAPKRDCGRHSVDTAAVRGLRFRP